MTTTIFPVILSNGEQVFAVPGGSLGAQQLTIACTTYPSAGTALIEYRSPGNTAWQTAYKGAATALTVERVMYVGDVASQFRVTLEGVVGGAGATFAVSDLATAVPPGAWEGTRGLIVQPYTEANVKNGMQYYLRAAWPLTDVIPTTESRKVWVKTGTQKVLVKLRDLQFVAEELRLELFRAPVTVTGGIDLTIQNYNSINPVVTTTVAKKNVTTVSDGVPFDAGDPEYFYGAAASPQRVAASIPQGRERVIPPNTEFIVKITNTGSGSARVQYFLDWFEGEPDLPT